MFGGALLLDERGDALPALIPTSERRHLPNRFGGEHFRDRIDVIALKCVDVLAELLAQHRVLGFQQGLFPWRHFLQLCTGTLQQTVHRGGGGADRLGDLLGFPLQHLAQHQHRALLGGQMLQCGDKRQTDRLP